jgi:hypothetical protein
MNLGRFLSVGNRKTSLLRNGNGQVYEFHVFSPWTSNCAIGDTSKIVKLVRHHAQGLGAGHCHFRDEWGLQVIWW